MSRELGIKTARLVEMLVREKLSGILLNGQHNFAWITGGANNGVDRSRENGAASVLITRNGFGYLLASGIEMPRMLAEEVSTEDFEPVEFGWQDEKASSTFLTDKASSLAGGEIASDVFLHPRIPILDGLVAQCRHELTDEEIDRYKTLGMDAAAALDSLATRFRPGMTELAIASAMRQELALAGIESVVTLVAADERIAEFRHPVPTRKLWNSTLLVVTCAKRHGLIASLSRMITVGAPSAELKEKTEAAAFVNAELLASTRPGATAADLYQIAKRAYEVAGFPSEIDKHHQGGASGYRTREWVAHPASGDVVKSRQAFAWNPSITGAKVEDTVVVSNEGVESLTSSNQFPVIIHTIEGREYKFSGVMSIPE